MPPRCFVAALLPSGSIAAVLRASAAFRDAAPGWTDEKWVPGGLLHMTVAFLGSVDDERLDDVIRSLRAIATSTAAFDLRPGGMRAVPSPRRASMLWADQDAPRDALTALRDACLEAAGADQDGRAFRSHVTLARARRPRAVPADALNAASAILTEYGKGTESIVSVRSLTVFSSTLGPTGPAYTPIAVLQLGGGDGGSVDTEHVFV